MKTNLTLRKARRVLLLPLLLGSLCSFGQNQLPVHVTAVKEKNQVPYGLKPAAPVNVAPDAPAIAAWLKVAAGANADFQLQLKGQETDFAGNDHYKYQQYYKGIPVEGSMVRAHYSAGLLAGLNGDFYPALRIAVKAALSESQALERALAQFPKQAVFAWELKGYEAIAQQLSKQPAASFYPKGELVAVSKEFSLQQEDFRLAYKFNVFAVAPLDRRIVYIDAENGALLGSVAQIHTTDVPATAHTRYSGVQTIVCDSLAPAHYELSDWSRGSGVHTINTRKDSYYYTLDPFINTSRDWDLKNADQDDVATDIHWGVEQTYDFYRSQMGRRSIDNADTTLIALAHYGVAFNNAFWNGSFASFGDGDSVYMYPITTLDICAHELTHGVTQYTAALQYMNESGALNESFSDILGKCVEHYAISAKSSWALGRGVMCSGSEMRNMKDPNKVLHPKYYRGLYYYIGTDDAGGVHTNSGVQNYWFYLMCDGGSGTREDDGAAFTVKPLGWEKAARLVYTTLNSYLTPWTYYPEAADQSIEAAKALFGAASDEAVQVQMGWYAVGLAKRPITAIPEVSAAIGFAAYPNPVSGNELHLTFTQALSQAQLRLLDMSGKVILQQAQLSGTSYNWNLPDLPHGVYLLELRAADQVSRIKLVK
jgi:Zn-dependent metalloprotease